MENVFILQVIVETPSYLKAIESFWDTDTQVEFKNFIATNFLLGDVIPNIEEEKKIMRDLVSQLKNSFRAEEFKND